MMSMSLRRPSLSGAAIVAGSIGILVILAVNVVFPLGEYQHPIVVIGWPVIFYISPMTSFSTVEVFWMTVGILTNIAFWCAVVASIAYGADLLAKKKRIQWRLLTLIVFCVVSGVFLFLNLSSRKEEVWVDSGSAGSNRLGTLESWGWPMTCATTFQEEGSLGDKTRNSLFAVISNAIVGLATAFSCAMLAERWCLRSSSIKHSHDGVAPSCSGQRLESPPNRE